MIDVLGFHQWRTNTDLQQVHCLPFSRRHCATVLPTWVKRIRERSAPIAHDSTSVPERHRCFMKRRIFGNISVQPGSLLSAIINTSFDVGLMGCARSTRSNSGQPQSPTYERRHHRDGNITLSPSDARHTSTLKAMLRTLRVFHITHGDVL